MPNRQRMFAKVNKTIAYVTKSLLELQVMTWFCSVMAPLELTSPSIAPAGLPSASSRKAFVGKLHQAAVAITTMVMIQSGPSGPRSGGGQCFTYLSPIYNDTA